MLSMLLLSWQVNGLNCLGIYSFFLMSDHFCEKHKSQIRSDLFAPLIIGLAGSWGGEANVSIPSIS